MGAENRAVDPFDIPQDPELSDLLRVVLRGLKLSIRTHCPATVVAYNPATQKAVVTVGTLPVVKVTDPTRLPSTMVALKGTPPNATATLAPIQLVDIPVVFLSSSTGAITVPIVPGDTGELHVSDRALDAWLAAGIPADPVRAATHLLSSGVFHPGLHPDTAPLSSTDLTATVVDGAALVKIGAAALSFIAKAPELATAVANAASAASAAAVPNDGGAVAFSTFASTFAGEVANFTATKGQVE